MKFFSTLVLFVVVLFSKDFTLYAPNLQKIDDKLISNDGVVVFSKDYFARAKSLEYDEKNNTLTLVGDVFINNKNSYTNASQTTINLENNSIFFKDFFLGDSDFEIWLRSKNAVYDSDKVILYDSYVSSCEVDKPTWKIGFKKGEFDVRSKDLSLKHSVFYYQNMPVFYMPFFDINIENARRSGFLVPDIGIKTKDGFAYRQPIYIAPKDYYDLQFDPILRTKRGYGLYSIFRFAGPNDMKLEFSGGRFDDFNSYLEENKLKNKTHYGVELFYSQNNMFFNHNYQEGLYIKGAYLNDVDYINLLAQDLKLDGNFINSKLNYFVSDDNNFYGLFVRYYIDTSKETNALTIQELPHLNYHRFTDGFFNDIFQYSINTDIKNFYKEEGSKATLYSFDAPLSINFSLLDDYLNIKLEEKIIANYATYTNSSKDHEYLFANSHSLSIGSNMSKKYSVFYHNINPEISLNIPSTFKGGFNEDYLYKHNDIKSTDFALTQFFYNLKNAKKLEHFIKFSYFNDNHVLGLLTNKFKYNFTHYMSISDEIAYDLKDKYLQKHFINFAVDIDKEFEASVGYFYSNIKELEEPLNKNLVHNLSYIYKNRYKVFYSFEYDLKAQELNQYSLGFTYRKKCINYTLMYKQTIDPVLAKNDDSIKQQGVYFTINLYPLGGVSYDYDL